MFDKKNNHKSIRKVEKLEIALKVFGEMAEQNWLWMLRRFVGGDIHNF